MTSIYERAQIFDAVSGAELAQVALNGTRIEKGSTLSFNGRMRSFKLLNGDLRRPWYANKTILLKHDEQDYTVRIAALPVKVGATGFVEFINC